MIAPHPTFDDLMRIALERHGVTAEEFQRYDGGYARNLRNEFAPHLPTADIADHAVLRVHAVSRSGVTRRRL